MENKAEALLKRQKRSPINFVAEKKIPLLYAMILSIELILNFWIHQRFDIIPEKESLGYFDRNPISYKSFYGFIYEKWGLPNFLLAIYFVVPIVAIIRNIFRKSYYNSLILFLSFITIGITTHLYAYGPGTFSYYYPFPSLLGLIGITLICSYLYYKKNINIQNSFYFFLTLIFMSVMRIAYYFIVIDFMKLHET